MSSTPTRFKRHGDEIAKRRQIIGIPKALSLEVEKLAQQGYGWQDCMAKLDLERTPIMREWVREVVMSMRANYRGWGR
jgi:hypothetical protein